MFFYIFITIKKGDIEMEKWDLYNENGEKLGKTIMRGEKMKPDEYHISVHVWIINNEKNFLIQKRASTKKKFPNMWSMTGGAVLAGETSEEACIREVSEELGISLDKNELKKLGRVKRKNGLVDIWIVYNNYDIKNLILQEEEVSCTKWADINEINNLLQRNEFTPSVVEGLKMCIKYITEKNK